MRGSLRGQELGARTTAPPLYPPLTRESGEDRSLPRAWRGVGGDLGARGGSEGLWEPSLLGPEAILIFHCRQKAI